MYERLPSLQEMQAAGFAPEDYESDPVDVWPECWPAFDLFCQMGTQWRMGMNGATGLDYNVLFRLMDNMKLTGPDWDYMISDIRTMESAALDQMRKQTT